MFFIVSVIIVCVVSLMYHLDVFEYIRNMSTGERIATGVVVLILLCVMCMIVQSSANTGTNTTTGTNTSESPETFGTYCDTCEGRTIGGCSGCINCGFVARDGYGSCVEGDMYGPYEDTDVDGLWVYNDPLWTSFYTGDGIYGSSSYLYRDIYPYYNKYRYPHLKHRNWRNKHWNTNRHGKYNSGWWSLSPNNRSSFGGIRNNTIRANSRIHQGNRSNMGGSGVNKTGTRRSGSSGKSSSGRKR